MPAATRRMEILNAVAPLFARLGLDGTTSRQLADAAGISEALLFRHFPNKQALYDEASRHQLKHSIPSDLIPPDVPPSTRRLVQTVHNLARHLDHINTTPLVQQTSFSLLKDGAQAKDYLALLSENLLPALQADLEAARSAGDCTPNTTGELELWLIQHLLFSMRLFTLPESPPLGYNCPRFELLKRAVSFALRGAGISQEAIEREHPSY